jgi:DNA-binding NtrC family response regulator
MSKLGRGTAVVLVADSEERVLAQVSATLAKAGFEVFTALSQSATLEFCHERRGPVQLAIIDSVMGTDSPELLRELCEFYPGVRVLFTGSQDESGAIQQSVPAGHSCGYLKKPFRRSRLLGSVLQAMDAPRARTA